MLRLDFNLVFTIINVLVFYLCMKKFLFGPIAGLLDQRQKLLNDQFENAQKTEQAAMGKKEQYEQALAAAKEESGRILDKARADARAEYDKVLMEADREAGKRLAEAERNILAEQDRKARELQSQIAVLAAAAAQKLLQNSQAVGAANNGRIYDQFIVGSGDAYDTDSN